MLQVLSNSIKRTILIDQQNNLLRLLKNKKMSINYGNDDITNLASREYHRNHKNYNDMLICCV